MGTPNPSPPPGLLFFGLLAVDDSLLDEARLRLEERWGRGGACSPPVDFTHSAYYAHEMGTSLRRQWMLSRRLIAPDEIAGIKLATNALEEQWRDGGSDGRRVNIDPGYVALPKVVLATTKDYAHRVYLGQGIYAEATLVYRRASAGFEPWPWTYPDYREPAALAFFNAARDEYQKARGGS
jgi:hypothetical protein